MVTNEWKVVYDNKDLTLYDIFKTHGTMWRPDDEPKIKHKRSKKRTLMPALPTPTPTEKKPVADPGSGDEGEVAVEDEPDEPEEPFEHEEIGAVTKALCHWKSQMTVTDNTIC